MEKQLFKLASLLYAVLVQLMLLKAQYVIVPTRVRLFKTKA